MLNLGLVDIWGPACLPVYPCCAHLCRVTLAPGELRLCHEGYRGEAATAAFMWPDQSQPDSCVIQTNANAKTATHAETLKDIMSVHKWLHICTNKHNFFSRIQELSNPAREIVLQQCNLFVHLNVFNSLSIWFSGPQQKEHKVLCDTKSYSYWNWLILNKCTHARLNICLINSEANQTNTKKTSVL